MSYAPMGPAEERPVRELEALLVAARAADAAEDVRYGLDRTGDELPEDLSEETDRRERRLAAIRAAKAALAAVQAKPAPRGRRVAGPPHDPRLPFPSAGDSFISDSLLTTKSR